MEQDKDYPTIKTNDRLITQSKRKPKTSGLRAIDGVRKRMAGCYAEAFPYSLIPNKWPFAQHVARKNSTIRSLLYKLMDC